MVSEHTTNCPLCNSFTATAQNSSVVSVEYSCQYCGKFVLTEEADDKITSLNYKSKLQIASFTIEKTLQGLNPFHIFSAQREVPLNSKSPSIGIDSILNEITRLKMSDRFDRTLMNLARISKEHGRAILIDENCTPMTFSWGREGLFFILKALSSDGLITDFDRLPCSIRLTMKGWNKVAELERMPLHPSNKTFVAMWFDKSTDKLYETISKAIKECGYDPIRIDLKHHNNKITDEIIAEIRGSKFIVADYTGQRGGVYFESGFAHGLGLKVIFLCKKDDMKELHFDIRDYNFIDWENEDDLCDRLIQRIRATIV